MKNIIVLWISVLLIVPFSVSCNKKNNAEMELKSELDSVSYSLGLVFAANFSRDGFDTVNIELIARGLDDYFSKNDFLIPGHQANNLLREYSEEALIGKLLVKYEDVRLEGEKFLEENSKMEGVVTLSSGLQYRILKEGNGPKPNSDELVMVYYKGWILSGEEFDRHLEGNPVPFKVDRVIQGWAEALQLMEEGAKWQLFIPYELGYGTEFRSESIIVPYSMLIFEIELIKVGSE